MIVLLQGMRRILYDSPPDSNEISSSVRHFCPYLRLSVLIACLFLSGTGHADESQRQQQELKSVRNQIAQLLEKIQTEQSEKTDIEKKLRSVETKLGKLRRAMGKLQKQIKGNTHKLSALKGQRAQLQRQLQQQRQLLAKQLHSAYISGNREQIKLILNQEDPAVLSRLSTYYDYINQARTQQIVATETTMTEIAKVGQAIEERNKTLKNLKQQHEVQRTTLISNLDTRKKVLRKIHTQLKKEGEKLNKLRRNEKDIQALITSLSQLLNDIPDGPTAHTDFAKLKGKLRWPTRGNAKNQFGESRHVGDLKWHGIMLGAPAGREVKAVASGRIAFADWLQGFGLLVIIDHDNGYLSLYGHNQILFKEAGDWVAINETISQVGNSGGLEQTALYFELRHKGKPINPRQWCVKR